ncbi:MAG: acylneuraminate cytidylyltransferase family protein [Proteobacteria bacterium]|nr:acylneuraminate cytidylyltransferase family protein [Pseudomonadota bacterium]
MSAADESNGIVLGLVPARGGSKSIPRKNVALLAGRPLLAYTAEPALRARRLDRVLLSTDDPAIAEAGRGLGLQVPFLRPSELARDDTPMLPVMIHALDWCAAQNINVAAVVLLQPTSPLRRAADIDATVDMLFDRAAETVVSVVEVPHRYSPASVMSMADGRLSPFLSGPMILRRQDKPRVYARNGPAVLVVRAEVLRRGELYGTPTCGYVMDEDSSLDIDEAADLERAEFLLSHRAAHA